MQALMQEDPQKQVREAFQGVFRNNSGSKDSDGLFKGIIWESAVYVNYPGMTGINSIVGVILPKEKIENSKWLLPVVDQFIAALEKIGLKVTDHGWMTTNTDKDYYGFVVIKK